MFYNWFYAYKNNAKKDFNFTKIWASRLKNTIEKDAYKQKKLDKTITSTKKT
jgi:hypothetical protein